MIRASCENCIRPIVWVPEVGWLHDELPQYAHQPITCGRAAPVELVCPACAQACERTNVGKVVKHPHPDGLYGGQCPGSWQPGLPLVPA